MCLRNRKRLNVSFLSFNNTKKKKETVMEAKAFQRALCEHCNSTPQQVIEREKKERWEEHEESSNGDSEQQKSTKYEWHDWWDHKDRCLREKRLRLKQELQLSEDIFSIFVNEGYCIDEVSKITEYLFLGDSYGARNARLLKKFNIKTVINMAEEVHIEDAFYTSLGIKRIWFRVADAPSHTDNIVALFGECVTLVEEAKKITTSGTTSTTTLTTTTTSTTLQRDGTIESESGGGILIHCAAGVSRSATVVLAALMHVEGMTLKDAFLWVRARRSIVYPNKGFFASLLRLERELFGTNSIPPAALTLHDDYSDL